MELDLSIDFVQHYPKYLQVVDAIIRCIGEGQLQRGDQLPSINELSEAYLLSRDTVEKAYRELRRKNIITSVKGKGNFINRVDVHAPLRVLLIFNKISNYKKQIYNSFVYTLGYPATVDLHIHHCNMQIFETLISNSIGHYDYYVIMPHFYEQPEKVAEIINRIPRDQLLLLDKDITGLGGEYASVFQDFEKDIYEALHDAFPVLKKYEKLIYVNPGLVPYPGEIMKGFRYFCRMNDFEYSIIEGVDAETEVSKGEAFVVIEETDLVTLIKNCRNKNLSIGKDVGIISYNETPLKEILLEGITVISTDHEQMGKTAAKLILEKRKERIKNPFQLILRKSL